MGALNLPSAADIERVTRRLRSLSQRLEGIEDAIDRLEERLGGASRRGPTTSGSAAIEERLDEIARDLAALRDGRGAGRTSRCRARRSASPSRDVLSAA